MIFAEAPGESCKFCGEMVMRTGLSVVSEGKDASVVEFVSTKVVAALRISKL